MNAVATALPSKQTNLRAIGEVRELLANQTAHAQLKAVAASHMTPERMMRLLALAIDKSADLAKATPMSVLGCLMTCASLGLEPNTVLNHAYIIPRKAKKKGNDGTWREVIEATLQLGYRGLMQLWHNSGLIAGIDAGVHYSDDEHWLYRKGAHGVLEHTPGPEQGDKLHAYAVVTLTNGNSIWVVWPWSKVLAHRDRYSDAYKFAVQKGRTDTPWIAQEDVMAMKTMLKQLSKFVPMASEISRAATLDGARADYQGFAMNPTAGLPEPESDGDQSDVEVTGVEEHKLIEDKPTAPIMQATTAAPVKEKAPAAPAPGLADIQAKAKAAAAARKPKEEPKPEPAAEVIEEEQTAEQAAEAPGPDFTALEARIWQDVEDAEPADAYTAIEEWEAQLTAWSEQDPEGHAAFMDRVSDREIASR